MIEARLYRLFDPRSKRCAIYSLPAHTPAPGVPAAVKTLAASGVDALELSLGQAQSLQEIAHRNKPALILRADISNFTSPEPFCRLLGNPLEQALRLDAAAVVANLIEASAHPLLGSQSVANLQKLAQSCRRYAMPLIVEIQIRSGSNGPQLLPLVSQAIDLGADILMVQSDQPQLTDLFKQGFPIPVFIRCSSLHSPTPWIKLGARGLLLGPAPDSLPPPPTWLHLIHSTGPTPKAFSQSAHSQSTN